MHYYCVLLAEDTSTGDMARFFQEPEQDFTIAPCCCCLLSPPPDTRPPPPLLLATDPDTLTMTMSLRRKPLWSRGAVLCQAALVLSSAWGGKHAWAEAARGESTTTVASASAQVETTGNRQLSAVGLEPPAEIVSKIMLGVPSGTLPEVNPLWRGSQGRPRRRLSSLPFNAPDIERRRQTGGRRRGEGMVMEEGLSVARDEGGGVMVVGAGPAAGAGGGTDGRMGDGRERRKLRGHRTRKRALRRGAAPVSRDSADSIREAQKEEEGRSLAIGVKAVATEGEDATLHRRFGGEASTVTSRVERRNERRAVDRAVFRAPPIVAGPSEEEEDAAEKKGGSVWSIWNQRRRAAGEQPQASATETQAHDDDEAVDGFGSVGLLAFLVCFGLLFCVVEGGNVCVAHGLSSRCLERIVAQTCVQLRG